jgi:hypothetical protein
VTEPGKVPGCYPEAGGWQVAARVRIPPSPPLTHRLSADLATRHGVVTLLDGEGMGEEIRVLVQAKGIDPAAVLDLAVLGGRPLSLG